MTAGAEVAEVRPAADGRPGAVRPWTSSPLALALAFLLLFGLQIARLVHQHPPYWEDDGAFFFRYAENLAAGHGFRWNPEEPPVWGASAPLWPVLLASGVKLGLGAAQSCLLWSWALALGATALLGLVAWRLSGVLGVLALAPLLTFNHLYSTWATSGMESPLTFFLIAAALALASSRASGAWPAIWTGVVGGLCLVHKVDLVPLGLALLGGVAVWQRERVRLSWPLAAAIACAWYGFAAWYFGFPLPNSFLRKMTAEWDELPRGWFVEHALWVGAGKLRLPLALLGVIALRRTPLLAALAGTQVLVPSLGYTAKPPSEQFMWYAAALSPAVAFLASCGLAWLLAALVGPGMRARSLLALALLAGTGGILWRLEEPRIRNWHGYLTWVVPPLIEAGEWIDANSEPDARVLTAWGNLAYSSRRFVYDATFLNRRPEEGNLLLKYEPEFWAQLHWGQSGEFQVPPEYELVRTITPAPESGPPEFRILVMRFRTLDPEQARLAEEAQKRKELVRRFLAGEIAGPGDVDQEELRELEAWAAEVRVKLGSLSDEERRAALEKYPELEGLERLLVELRGGG